MGAIDAVRSRTWSGVAWRTAGVLAVSLLAGAGVMTLALGGLGDLAPGTTDLLALPVFVVLVVAGTTAIHHATRRGEVWRGRAARWWYAALVSLVTILAMGVVAVVTAMLEPAEPAVKTSSTLGVALLVWVFVVLVTGLPAWTFLLGVALGPGAPPDPDGSTSGTGRRGRETRRTVRETASLEADEGAHDGASPETQEGR